MLKVNACAIGRGVFLLLSNLIGPSCGGDRGEFGGRRGDVGGGGDREVDEEWEVGGVMAEEEAGDAMLGEPEKGRKIYNFKTPHLSYDPRY